MEAYQASKIKALHVGKERLLTDVAALVGDVKEQVLAESEVHNAVSMMSPLKGTDALSSICVECERELGILNQQLDEGVKRDKDLTSRLQLLQDQIAEAIPRVQREKDNDIEEIQIEWENEKRHLLTIYGKLCVVNREQNYHLQRGTHIKRAAAKPVVDPTETKLSMNATDLAREINSTKDRLKLNDLTQTQMQRSAITERTDTSPQRAIEYRPRSQLE